jgi:CheY-like chemotaxis protein
METVSILETLEECQSLALPMAAQSGIELLFPSSDAADLWVFADSTRLKQIILNLITNAIKYNRPNGKVHVRIHTENRPYVRITVQDTGIGIDPQYQLEIFKPFERLGAENSEIEGTGIGLVITKRLVELMGGRIGFTSEVGTGSVFSVEIKRTESPIGRNDMLENQGEVDLLLTPSVKRKKRLLLYIEDNPANYRLIQQVVKLRDNYALLHASTAEAGIELAVEHGPDLILLDINLPGISGFDALVKLRKEEKTKNIPVVAVTANAMNADIEQGHSAGFDDYLTKPIDINVFFDTVECNLSREGV